MIYGPYLPTAFTSWRQNDNKRIKTIFLKTENNRDELQHDFLEDGKKCTRDRRFRRLGELKSLWAVGKAQKQVFLLVQENLQKAQELGR